MISHMECVLHLNKRPTTVCTGSSFGQPNTFDSPMPQPSCGLVFRFLFSYALMHVPGSPARKTFVVACKKCRRDVPTGVGEFPIQSIAVECPLCGEKRRLSAIRGIPRTGRSAGQSPEARGGCLMFDPDAHLPRINRGLIYLGACLIVGIRLARERQVNVRVVPTRQAIEESVDLAHEVYTQVFRKVPDKVKDIH
jgi:hypothetical protein